MDNPPGAAAGGDDAGTGAERTGSERPGDQPRGDGRPGDEALLDDYQALSDPARRRQVERAGDFFVVEGALALEALLGSRYPVRSVLVADSKLDRVRPLLAAAPAGGDVRVVVRPAREVAAITGFAFHRGVLASGSRLPLPPAGEILAAARTVTVLEGLNDHENLGSLFRNAAAFGVDAVLLDPTTADPLYRRSVRVSLGHVLRVPWTRVSDWPGALDDLRNRGFTVVALTPTPGAEDIDDLAARPPARFALLLGAEGPGISPEAGARADRRVRIPMAAGVDSLNVATAAAIAFHRLAPRREA
ncbi:MAG TPA: RNA methyltransferase [Acidimicrobiales bacterium]